MQVKGGMGGRHAATTQGFHGKEGVLLAPPLGVCLFLSLLAVLPSPILAATFHATASSLFFSIFLS